jgi:hypothetical protein
MAVTNRYIFGFEMAIGTNLQYGTMLLASDSGLFMVSGKQCGGSCGPGNMKFYDSTKSTTAVTVSTGNSTIYADLLVQFTVTNDTVCLGPFGGLNNLCLTNY